MKALIDKSLFTGLDSCTWLYSGAESPPLAGGAAEVSRYMSNRALGPDGRAMNSEIEQACKENVARLLGGNADSIAFMPNSSDVISMIALALDLQAGDNVIVNTLEFPSGILPWLLLKEKGVEVRVVQHTGWKVSVAAILEQVDARTRLVLTSHVSYLTGARFDYRSLYAHLKHTSTLLVLDATQSLGVVPVDMNEADFVICSSYKWLLSIHGLGILAANPRRTALFTPKSAGWRSVTDMFSDNRFDRLKFHADARKYETGYPSYPSIYSLYHSTGLLLDIGIANIEQHVLKLGGYLLDKLVAAGFEPMTPRAPEARAGNICIINPYGEQAAEYLRQQQVYVWGGDGRLRASIHLFNDSADIDRYMDLLLQFSPPVAVEAKEAAE